MGIRFLCAQGHLWDNEFDNPSLVDGQIRCPVCGSNSVSPEPAQPPSNLPSAKIAILSTEIDPEVVGAFPATEFRPGLAGLTPISLDSKEGRQRPIVPSHLLTRLSSDTHQSVPDGASGKATPLPHVPGYDLLEELGRGGMGVVYKARQIGLNRLVALKMILSGSHASESDRNRFRVEGEAIARLQHPNIVQIYDVGEHEGTAYFSLEFVDGGSLADRLQGQPASVVEAARLVEQLARAMHLAHEHGVVHRDIKPGNVLLAAPPRSQAERSADTRLSACVPKITDFGLAKTLDRDLHQTRSGMAVGTPAYMSPEQASGTQRVGPPTDIYALGVLLYEMVSGKMPFVAPTAMEVMIQVTQQEPPPPSRWVPRLARDMETIILKCLEKDPNRRYPTALALAEDLRRFLDHEPIQARPVGKLERALRYVRRRKWQAMVMGAVTTAVLAVLTTFAVSAHAEQQRNALERKEIQASLDKAHQVADRGKWKEVDFLTAELTKRIGNKKYLADLSNDVRQLQQMAASKLQAQNTVERFEHARDDALFLATLASGSGSRSHLEQTRVKILNALSLLGANDQQLPARDDHFSAEDRKTVQDGCYELYLVLAETTVALGDPARSAIQALAILDTADRLGVRTRAYYQRRARYHDLAGQTIQAKKYLDLAEKCPPKTALDYYMIGAEQYRLGKITDAERAFDMAVRLKTDHFWATYFLALCHVCQGQLIAARDNLTACQGLKPEVIWIYLLRGYVQGQLQNYDLAEADFKSALEKLNPKQDRGAYYGLLNNWAVTQLGRNRYKEAEANLRRAIALAPEHYQAHVTLSQVLHQQKKHKEARAALEQGIACAEAQRKANELDVGTLTLLYRMRYRLDVEGKDTTAALEDLKSLIDLGALPHKAKARAERDRGHLLYRAGKLAEALDAYTQAVKAAPDEPDAYRWQGQVLLKLKRYADAIRAFDSYFKLGGKGEASIYRGRAIAHVQTGSDDLAVRDFSHALELIPKRGPKDADLLVQRGQRYLVLRAWVLAEKDFDAALKLDSKMPAAYQGRGLARLQQEKVNEAAADAEEAARLAGQDWRQLYGAATLFAQIAGQVLPPLDAPSGSFEARQARLLRGRYQDRAVALLRHALENRPADERRSFWKETVQREPALRPLWLHEGYTRLEQQFGR